MTVISILAILKKVIFFVDTRETSCPSSIAIVSVVTIALRTKKDLSHYNTALSPLSHLTLFISSSLLLIQKSFKGQVDCAGIQGLRPTARRQQTFMVISMIQLQFSKVFRHMLD